MSNLVNKPSIPVSWDTLGTAQAVNTATSSVQFLSEPDEITASENLQRFRFTPRVVNLAATAARVELLVTAGTPVASTFVISGNGVTVTLTSSATPSFDEFYSDNTNTAVARARVAQAIAAELTNNLAFNTYYETHSEDNRIIIEARDLGSAYDLTVTTLPASIITFINSAGSSIYDYQSYIDYSTFTEFYIGYGEYGNVVNRLDFDLIGNIDIPFSSDVSNININGATKNYVDIELPYKRPNVGLSIKELDEEAYNAGRMPILRPYFVLYGDSFRYSANGEKKKILQGVSSVLWVQNAAQHKLNTYDFRDYTWDLSSINSFKFLTDRPNLTPVTYDSHQFLQTIHKKYSKADGTFWLERILHFYDGSTQTTLLGGTPGVDYSNLNGNLSFDVSPVALGIENTETIEGKLVDWYEVCIVWSQKATGSVYRSEKKSYKFLRRCGDQSANIIWFNKFGAWDSLEFVGTQTEARNRNTSVVNRALPFTANTGTAGVSFAASEEVTLVRKIDSETSKSVTSVLLPKAHYDWVGGILDSSAVFIWDTVQKQYVAIVVTGFEYSSTTDLDEFAIRVEYKSTVDNNTITR